MSDASAAASTAYVERTARRGGRWRGASVVALVVLACLAFTAAVPAVWARRNFLDTDRFVSRVGPVVDEPDVQVAIATRLTDELMRVVQPRRLFAEALPERGQILAVPLANAVQGFVEQRVETFVASDEFARLFDDLVRIAHERAVRVLEDKSDAITTGDGQVTFNLLPMMGAVLRDITQQSPDVLGRDVTISNIPVDELPSRAIARLEDALGVQLDDNLGQFTVYDEGRLETVQTSVKWFDRLAPWLLPLAIVLAALAIWLSRRRRRTILELTVGVMLGMVLLRRVAFRLDDELASLPPTAQGRTATAAVVDAFLDPLLTFTMWTLALALIVAVVALVTGSASWAIALRRRASALSAQLVAGTGGRGRDEAVVAWVRDHRDVLLACGAFGGLIVLWSTDLSWAGLVLVLALIAAYELVVYRVGSTPQEA